MPVLIIIAVPLSSTIGVLGVVYRVVENFNVAFGGEVGFRN
jgi:hypothetical protein